MAVAEIVQDPWTVAVTLKVAVCVVAAAGVEARPKVKHPRMAADSVDLTVFENFIKMTPGRN
jgi:hypothetical protein